MNSEQVWLAVAVAAIPCVILDVAINAVQRWQKRKAGALPGGPGPVGEFFLSVFSNFVLVSGFCFLYAALWGGSGRSLLYGGMIWLLLVIPFIFMLNHMDDLQRRIMTIRMFGWFFKICAATASLAYYIG